MDIPRFLLDIIIAPVVFFLIIFLPVLDGCPLPFSKHFGEEVTVAPFGLLVKYKSTTDSNGRDYYLRSRVSGLARKLNSENITEHQKWISSSIPINDYKKFKVTSVFLQTMGVGIAGYDYMCVMREQGGGQLVFVTNCEDLSEIRIVTSQFKKAEDILRKEGRVLLTSLCLNPNQDLNKIMNPIKTNFNAPMVFMANTKDELTDYFLAEFHFGFYDSDMIAISPSVDLSACGELFQLERSSLDIDSLPYESKYVCERGYFNTAVLFLKDAIDIKKYSKEIECASNFFSNKEQFVYSIYLKR